MSKRRTIPIRFKQQEPEDQDSSAPQNPVEDAAPPVVEAGPPPWPDPEAVGEEQTEGLASLSPEGLAAMGEELEKWRDRALRLEAEMDNFRKRQRRLAEDRIAAERDRLLFAFLGVADNLSRALASQLEEADSLREGVQLTHQGLMRILRQEGVEPIEAQGQPFDPQWHEAVGTVDAGQTDVQPDQVAHVVQPGYRIDERLLRPARVIVAT